LQSLALLNNPVASSCTFYQHKTHQTISIAAIKTSLSQTGTLTADSFPYVLRAPRLCITRQQHAISNQNRTQQTSKSVIHHLLRR
jgi:hypothetical protein